MTTQRKENLLSPEMEHQFLETDFLGFHLKNPFVLASAPPTKDYATIRRGFEAGWAGAITKSVVPEPLVDKMPRIGHIKNKNKVLASQNFEMGSEYPKEYWLDWVKKLRAEFPDRLLYVSLFASTDIEEWKELTAYFLNSGAHGFELNFSCPHSDHNGKGSLLGQNIELCAEITRTVKQMVGSDIKVMPKLPYLIHPNEGLMSRALTEAGADALAAINTIAGLCEFDIHTMKPELHVGGKTTGGGISYDTIRPFGRLIVANMASSIDWKSIPISAMGGVSRKTSSMVEYFLLGANHLQVCTEVMNSGFGVIDKMKKKLIRYFLETGFTLDQIRGSAVQSVVAWDHLDDVIRRARLNTKKCSKCYRCFKACMYQAITIKEGRVPIFDTERCSACGSCVAICPKRAIEMVEL